MCNLGEKNLIPAGNMPLSEEMIQMYEDRNNLAAGAGYYLPEQNKKENDKSE